MSAMPHLRPGPLLALALAGGVPAAAMAARPAAGAVAFSASVSPQTVRSPARIVYALTMTNDGEAQERFSVALVSPVYRPARTGDAIVESNAVRQAADPAIEGSATILGGFTRVAGLLAACSAAGAGGHGYGLGGTSFDVGLPPRSTSTLRVEYQAGLAFWPDLDLRLRFLIGSRLTTGKAGTLAGDRKLLTPQPAIAGRVAVHLTFRTTPASGLASFMGKPPIARGKAVAVSGRANPAIPGQRVELRYARIGSRSDVLERGRAARPRVAKDGTFRARWTPKRPAATSCGRATAASAPACCPTTRARGCCACAGRSRGQRPTRTDAIAGSRLATPNQVLPASREPKISPAVAPK